MELRDKVEFGAEQNNKRIETRRILTYIGITFGITWLYALLVIYPIMNSENLSIVITAIAQFAVAGTMFMPTIGVILTRIITKEGFQDCWIKPNLLKKKGNLKYYVLAYFGPGILVLLGALVYFLIFPNDFDTSCGYMVMTLEATGSTQNDLSVSIPLLMAIQCVQALLLGPIMNFITCFGEEWGWRGYLVPKMSGKMAGIPMVLVTGIIWGLWHAPLTIIGHNYGMDYPGFPFAGIAMMCLFCVVLGTFLSYVSLKTQSCIPAVIGHGAINSIASIGMFFTKDGGNPFVGPVPTGIVGMLPFIVVAAVMCLLYFGKMRATDDSIEEK